MPRGPVICKQAHMARAAKVARQNGMYVEIKPDGTIILYPVDSGDERQNTIAAEKEYRL